MVGKLPSRKNSAVFQFLPPEGVNQREPPRLIIKRTPGDIPDNSTDPKSERKLTRKKVSTEVSAEEMTQREEKVCDLLKKCEELNQMWKQVQVESEQLLHLQTGSEEFQKHMKKVSELEFSKC